MATYGGNGRILSLLLENSANPNIQVRKIVNKARQTRFIVSHQPLIQFACGGVVIILIIHYSLLAKTVYAR